MGIPVETLWGMQKFSQISVELTYKNPVGSHTFRITVEFMWLGRELLYNKNVMRGGHMLVAALRSTGVESDVNIRYGEQQEWSPLYHAVACNNKKKNATHCCRIARYSTVHANKREIVVSCVRSKAPVWRQIGKFVSHFTNS